MMMLGDDMTVTFVIKGDNDGDDDDNDEDDNIRGPGR